MLVIATYGEVAALLFHTPTEYGSDRFRQIFIFGRDLVFKPHVHLIMTKGGLDKEGVG